jgi:hypothetical protein
MLDIRDAGPSGGRRASRRDFIRVGAAAVLGLSLADRLRAEDLGQTKPGKANAVIQLWMNGGPSHIDTFDPKPEASYGITGPLRTPLATNVSGIRISELLPKLAKLADKFSVIRSLTHGNNGHETAAYIMMTGTPTSADLVYPVLGAVVAQKKFYEAKNPGKLPPHVTLTTPLGRISEAGFLGAHQKSFATGGDPNAKDFRVQGMVPPRGMTPEQIQRRRSLVQTVDALAADMENEPLFRTLDAYQQQAYGLILGDAKKAFDMSLEKDDLREKYGRNTFGQSCLLARRLVEHGVNFVTVNMGGWDTHTENFVALRNRLAPVLDQGFAALLEDLAQRGLLESTVVLWCGEFGRTPRVASEPPWFGGRHHYGQVFSAVVAGGGFQGGHVVGASDARGETVKDRPVYPWDLSASIYRLLGIDPLGKLPHPQGCVTYVTPLATGEVPSGGLLTEIM